MPAILQAHARVKFEHGEDDAEKQHHAQDRSHDGEEESGWRTIRRRRLLRKERQHPAKGEEAADEEKPQTPQHAQDAGDVEPDLEQAQMIRIERRLDGWIARRRERRERRVHAVRITLGDFVGPAR